MRANIAAFEVHCAEKAEQLQKFGVIHKGTVAKLVYGEVAKANSKCEVIARIIKAETGSDQWAPEAVKLGYKLRKLNETELAARDPKPPEAPKVPEQFAQVNAFAQFLAGQGRQVAAK